VHYLFLCVLITGPFSVQARFRQQR